MNRRLIRALLAIVAAAALLAGGVAAPAEAATRRFSSVATPKISGTPQVGRTLTAKPDKSKPAATSWKYQWYRSGTKILGATGRTYRLVAADRGKRITVKATAKRSGYQARTSKASKQTATVQPGILSAPTPTITGTAEVGRSLTAKPGTWTAGTTLAFQWLRGGTTIPGATKPAYPLTVSDFGAAISVRVTGTLTGYTSRSVTSKATSPVIIARTPVEPGPPATDVPVVWGLSHVGATLAVDPGEWPAGTSFTYQWLRDGSPIAGSTDSHYVVIPTDRDREISVRVTGSEAGQASTSRTSAALSIYQPGVLTISFDGLRCTKNPALLLETTREDTVVQWSTGERTVLPGEPYGSETSSIDLATVPAGRFEVTVTGRTSRFVPSGCPLTVRAWDDDLGLTTLAGSLRLADTVPGHLPSTVTDLANAFGDNYTFNQNINSWDTSNVTDLSRMFLNAKAFNQPLNKWNTSKVTKTVHMFANATSFNQPIGTWNTSNVKNMGSMFQGATAFNQPLGAWNTANVTSMASMFHDATAFNQPIGTWNTANVTRMDGMFFRAMAFNQPIGAWNTGNVTDLSAMFLLAPAFNQPIGGWDTSSVTSLNSMFSGAAAFNQPIGTWNTANVTDMIAVFHQATSFNQPIGNWNTANATRMGYMFDGASRFNRPIGSWNTALVWNMDSMFNEATAFDQDLDCWDVSRILAEPPAFRTGSATTWLSPKWHQPPSCG